MTAPVGAVPAQAHVEPVQKKSDCKTIAGTIAAVVGGIALAALAAFAYIKGYLQPLITNAGYVFQIVANFATKSPLNATILVVGVVGLVALGIFLGKLAVDAINKRCNKKAEEPKVEEQPKAPKQAQEDEKVEIDVEVNTDSRRSESQAA